MSHIQMMDGIACELKESFDFSFLSEYGRVFKVFDQQDSGNICFGVDNGAQRVFIKFAGAPTVRGTITPEEAVDNLKKTIPLYRDMAHENLIQLLETREVAGGFAMVFAWYDAKCMGRMYPQDHEHFMAASMEEKLEVFACIQRFMKHVHEKGYTAIDFYDGSIMYDFAAGKTLVCDIDFFRRKPCVNDMGRMWGSSRFMSPEEYAKGAVLDEVTNVYTLGAMAFALFAECSRNLTDWPLKRAAFETARRAVSDDRAGRYPTIEAFMEAWQNSLKG